MKKIYSFISFILIFLVSACAAKEAQVVKLLVPDGTPVLSLLSLVSDPLEHKGKKIEVSLVGPTEIAQRFSLESSQIALMPTVNAAKLHSKGIDLKLFSINVLGSLFLVGNDEINSLNDIKGSKIYTTQGTTIELIKYILSKSSISYTLGEGDKDVSLMPLSSGAEIVQALKTKGGFGVLGEPVVTQALGKGLKIGLDLNSEYKKISNNDFFPQAGIVVKGGFLKSNKELIGKLEERLSNNSLFLEENLENIPDILKTINSSISSIAYSKETIDRCNISFKKASLYKESINSYLKLMNNDYKEEGFYYED